MCECLAHHPFLILLYILPVRMSASERSPVMLNFMVRVRIRLYVFTSGFGGRIRAVSVIIINKAAIHTLRSMTNYRDQR